MNNPVYFGLSILETITIAMCEFWYNYEKPIYGKKLKLDYMNTDSFTAHIKLHKIDIYVQTSVDIYVDITKDVEIRFDTLNNEFGRP